MRDSIALISPTSDLSSTESRPIRWSTTEPKYRTKPKSRIPSTDFTERIAQFRTGSDTLAVGTMILELTRVNVTASRDYDIRDYENGLTSRHAKLYTRVS